MNVAKFVLRGKPYRLTTSKVREVLQDVAPEPLDKYAVLVGSRHYPPKQVVATALGIPVADFTTQDALRILTKLGITAHETVATQRTSSELLFESYLHQNRLIDYSFEPALPGASKRPDYVLHHRGGEEVICEIKEFRATPEDFAPGFGSVDAYGPIREKINQAREKFRGLKGKPCALVLCNIDKPLIFLDWQHVFAAMLGNLAFSVPLHLDSDSPPKDAPIKTVFSSGGKMRSPQGDVQNTTISAIIRLQSLPVGKIRFRAHYAKDPSLDFNSEMEKYFERVDAARGTDRDWSLMQLRVVVHENPLAATPLPDVFRGPYDERYGWRNGRIGRLWAGEEIAKLPLEFSDLW